MLVKSRIKYIQSLSDKKLRDQEAVFVAEGPRCVGELLASGFTELKELYATASWLETHSGLAARIPDNRQTVITENELVRISSLTTPHEVLAVFSRPVFPANWVQQSPWTLVLDAIQDPGNMGTIIRCADWFGVRRLVCSEETTDAYAAKVVQASMGSLSRVQVLYTELNSFLDAHAGVPVYTAVTDGQDIAGFTGKKPGMLIIGNEAKGIRGSLRQRPSVIPVTIPRKGQAESLNAAVATGILLAYLT